MKFWQVIASRLIGAYCPEDQEQRETRTDAAVTNAEAARGRNEKANKRAAAMIRSYQECDARLGNR